MDISQLLTDALLDRLLLGVVIACALFALFTDLRTLWQIWANRKKDTTRWIKSPSEQSGAGHAREFSYKGAARLGVLFVHSAGIASVVVCLLAAVLLVEWAFGSNVFAANDVVRCLLLVDLAAGWFIGAGLVNAFPNVWVGEEGIAISVYFTGRVLIPWSDLIEVKRWSTVPGCYIVSARQITPMHQLYGWLNRTHLPSFLVHQSIDASAELFQTLNRQRGFVGNAPPRLRG